MLHLYNSLTRQIEDFKPINPPEVGVYTCGPTVYDFAHIGNFRTYTTSDLLVRILNFNKYTVSYIMNLTDVGHLTGDNLGDADTGEDRMEKSAQKTGKSVWDIAQYYTEAFFKDYEDLNLTKPKLFVKATDHIQEQILMIQVLEEKGFTYKTSDGIYFDTSQFPKYGTLSNLDQIKEGARVEINPEKKNPKDFALWKFSPKNEKRQMEWESPWGIGFPGWHIECSAMSIKYLGDHFDIHVGGVDLKETHHPNEIAQSEAATGIQFVNYWIHGAFILIDGKRMSKSLGNNYKLQDLIKKGYDPLALRYLYMQTHYRQEMNFTFESLEAAQNALNKLREEVSQMGKKGAVSMEYLNRFEGSINDDLNMPEALSIVWELIKSEEEEGVKYATLLKMDTVLGLEFSKVETYKTSEFEKVAVTYMPHVPTEVIQLAVEREHLRIQKRFHLADDLRDKLKKQGYEVEDMGKRAIRIKTL